MGKPTKPKPVKVFVGLLMATRGIESELEEDLQGKLGPIGEKSELFSFDFTNYYQDEMGKKIKRRFYSFRNLINPEKLADIKLMTNEIESSFSDPETFDVKRPVNIDPGYIGLSKMVLATTKNFSHRIYLRKGIYAEVTLRYEDGSFRPQPWTYPDYESDNYLKFFDKLRDKYHKQLHSD